jgi:hypothetical protein
MAWHRRKEDIEEERNRPLEKEDDHEKDGETHKEDETAAIIKIMTALLKRNAIRRRRREINRRSR